MESITCPWLRTSELWDQNSHPYLRISKQVLYTQLLFLFLFFGLFVFVFITRLKRICGSPNPPPAMWHSPPQRSPEGDFPAEQRAAGAAKAELKAGLLC